MTAETACSLRFAGDLPGLLTVSARPCPGGAAVSWPVTRRASVKDVAESVGVPHTEIHAVCARIRGRKRERDFSLILEPGMEVDLLPGEPPVDPTKPTRLRPEPLESLRFLVDENVARLALFLRLLGYDAAHDSGWTDDHIARLARTQGRVVLTRDRQLLKRSPIVHGRLVRSQDPRAQIEETARFFGLTRPASPSFDRCLRCNRLLESVDKAVIEDRLLPKTRKYYHEFRRCPGCDRIYWQGSHPEKMAALVESLDIPTRQPVALEKGHKTL